MRGTHGAPSLHPVESSEDIAPRMTHRTSSVVRGRVAIVILNWNGSADTIECLESVFRLEHPDYRVVVCDNGSTDGSLGHLKSWAEGRLDPWTAPNNPLRSRSYPPVPKPIPYLQYDRIEAERGEVSDAREIPLVLIDNGTNLGFAGGNNVALRYLLARGDAEYVWLLNNDTVVAPAALTHLASRIGRHPGAGLCGSTLLYYHSPGTVQALGGATYNKWLGSAQQIHQFSPWRGPEQVDERAVERQLFGIQGASVLVTREFLERVGLLAEEYFLYFEEQDWAVRARRSGFQLVFSAASVVHHKEGASTGGSSRAPMEKSRLSDYHLIRSRLLFTRKFYPYALPSVYIGLVGTIFNRIRRRQRDRIPMLISLSLRALRSGGAGR